MTMLATAWALWALFLAMVSPRFWRDLPRSAVIVLAGLTMASLLRELARQPVFAFDQQVGFAVAIAATMAYLVAKSRRLPELASLSLVLWGTLEVLAILFLGRPAGPRDYIEQSAVAYFAALVGVWAIVYIGRIVLGRTQADGESSETQTAAPQARRPS